MLPKICKTHKSVFHTEANLFTTIIWV